MDKLLLLHDFILQLHCIVLLHKYQVHIEHKHINKYIIHIYIYTYTIPYINDISTKYIYIVLKVIYFNNISIRERHTSKQLCHRQ